MLDYKPLQYARLTTGEDHHDDMGDCWGEMAQQLRVITGLPEDPNSVLAPMVGGDSKLPITPDPGYDAFSGLHGHWHTCRMDTQIKVLVIKVNYWEEILRISDSLTAYY